MQCAFGGTLSKMIKGILGTHPCKKVRHFLATGQCLRPIIGNIFQPTSEGAINYAHFYTSSYCYSSRSLGGQY